jgi:hypothetical protein
MSKAIKTRELQAEEAAGPRACGECKCDEVSFQTTLEVHVSGVSSLGLCSGHEQVWCRQ